jgi:phospholipase C
MIRLPNPQMDSQHPHVPKNMPAVGDLFDMFDFDQATPGRAADKRPPA